jgi:cell division septation protein DedD
MAHNISARYEEQEHLFLPPLRTLGFNPQLNINDSLLVQSYIEAYDISYPEALQRIEDEVEELKQHLQNEGSYELNDIGTLALNEDGNYVFTPCEAGILTPALYGLSSVEMSRIGAIQPQQQPQPGAVVTPGEPSEEPTAKIVDIDTESADTDAEYEEEEEADVVRIKYSWIRNAVAVAAILLAVFILALPNSKTDMMQRTISNLNNGLLFGMMSEDTNTSKITISKNVKTISRSEECGVRSENTQKADSIAKSVADATTKSVADSTATGNLTPHSSLHTPQENATPQKTYCIVLASYVSVRNANLFIERLQKQGFDQAEIFERNNIRRVIYGHYASENDAYNDLRRFHRQSETAEAWVMSL